MGRATAGAAVLFWGELAPMSTPAVAPSYAPVPSHPHSATDHAVNGGKVGGKATMAGLHGQRISSMGGKVGGLRADPAKQKAGGPCSKCESTQSCRWHPGPQCSACNRAEYRERKRKEQQAEGKGKLTIAEAFASQAVNVDVACLLPLSCQRPVNDKTGSGSCPSFCKSVLMGTL